MTLKVAMGRARTIPNRCEDSGEGEEGNTINCSQEPFSPCEVLGTTKAKRPPDDFMHDARQAPPHVDDSRSLSSTDPDRTKAGPTETKTVSLYHVFEHA
jgi:hypothetical protein